MAHQEGVVVDCQKPEQTYFKEYKYKVYAMTTATYNKKNH